MMLCSNKPAYLEKDANGRPNNDASDAKRTDPDLTYRLAQLKNYIFEKHIYRIPLSRKVDLVLVNFSAKTVTKIILTLERNMNRLFESNKKVANIPDSPDALINIYDRRLTQGIDIYFNGILRSETALREGVLPSPYQ